MELSVVIPVLNEADNVGPLLEEVVAALEGGLAFEVIYVDDGSTDATPRILADLAARFPMLRIVTHARRYGQSAAIRSGVIAARATWIATLDGDRQNVPADLPRLWARASAPDAPAMIAGQRQKRQDTWTKRISSRIANKVRAAILKDGVTDTGCGLKLFRREVYLSLPYFDHMHRYLPALVRRQGERVETAQVGHRHRPAGTSKYGTLDRLIVGISDLLGVWWLIRRSNFPVELKRPAGPGA
jgi:dolichol-phosphate mannosyltransferase